MQHAAVTVTFTGICTRPAMERSSLSSPSRLAFGFAENKHKYMSSPEAATPASPPRGRMMCSKQPLLMSKWGLLGPLPFLREESGRSAAGGS